MKGKQTYHQLTIHSISDSTHDPESNHRNSILKARFIPEAKNPPNGAINEANVAITKA
jgi:hypothetical protein